MPSDPGPELAVRPALPEDAPALAELYLASRAAAVPAIPPGVHPPDDVRRWATTWWDGDRSEVWLAEEGSDPGPVGLLLIEQDWLHSLYVATGRTGEGVGSLLLALAKARRPRGLGLWVFETNAGARRFYARHGFVEVRRTDGSDNEERAPDLELAWPGSPR